MDKRPVPQLVPSLISIRLFAYFRRLRTPHQGLWLLVASSLSFSIRPSSLRSFVYFLLPLLLVMLRRQVFVIRLHFMLRLQARVQPLRTRWLD